MFGGIMGKSLVQSKTAQAIGILGLLANGTLTPAITAILSTLGVVVSAGTINGVVTIAAVLYGFYGRETATQPITGIITPAKVTS